MKTNQVEKIALDTFNQLLANPKQLEPNCYPNFDEMSNSNFVKNLKISCDGNEVTVCQFWSNWSLFIWSKNDQC